MLRKADSDRAWREAPENEQQREFVSQWAKWVCENRNSAASGFGFSSPPRLQDALGASPENASATRSRSQAPEARERQSLGRTRQTDSASGTWFARLVGFSEGNRAEVHQQLSVHGNQLRSAVNDAVFNCGRLELASLGSLREQVAELPLAGKLRVSELVGDAQALHADEAHAGAIFQVASQFNLLEMISPGVTPDHGVGIYENDPTQGPACAIACGAGTIYRNYFVELDSQLGQTATRQIDCLAGIGKTLGNTRHELWVMRNGYALPSSAGLAEVDRQLSAMTQAELDGLRAQLQIGVQWDSQVTLAGSQHLVTQAYCSALPVAYSGLPVRLWERFARLVLEAAYEATLAAAVLNSINTGNRSVFLTLLGGGAFGNDQEWIMDAIARALNLYRKADLDVKIISFRKSNPRVRQLCQLQGRADDDAV